MTANSFKVQVELFAENAKAKTDLAIRKTAMEVFSRVIMRTPVDTGRARGNWQLGVDEYISSTVDRTDKGPVTQNGSGNSSVKADMMATVSGAPFKERFTLMNNLPYIQTLEYGREDGSPGSLQAPNGMVRTTIAEFQDMVAKAARDAKNS